MKSKLLGLDITRAVAALGVMAFHLGYFNFPELKFFWIGRYGVEVFFVISGFVIAFSASKTTAKDFITSRFLRLYPAALISATLTFVVLLWMSKESSKTLVIQYISTILFNPFEPWIDAVYWTLGIEVAFYTVIALILATGMRHRLEDFCYLLGAYSCIMWAFHALGYLPASWPAYWPRFAMLLLAPYGVYFAFGAALWAGCLNGWTLKRKVAAFCLGIGGYAGLYRAHMVWTADTNNASPFIPATAWALIIIAMLLMTWAEKHHQFSEKTHRIIRFIGLTTYPLYLTHYFIGRQIISDLFSLGVNRWAALAVTCSLMILIAMLITAYAEPWLRNTFKKRLRPSKLAYEAPGHV